MILDSVIVVGYLYMAAAFDALIAETRCKKGEAQCGQESEGVS